MSTTIPASPLMTTQEAADYLRTPRKTLEHWRYVGKGPKCGKIGRTVMYRLADLDAFISAQMEG